MDSTVVKKSSSGGFTTTKTIGGKTTSFSSDRFGTSTTTPTKTSSTFTSLIRPGVIKGPSPSDSPAFTQQVRDQPQLRDIEIERTSSGGTRLVTRTSSGGTQPVSKPTQLVSPQQETQQEIQEEDKSVLDKRKEQISLSQKEDLEEEQKQEQIKQAIKERGVAEAVSEEPRTSPAELQEKVDKTKLARQALEGLSLGGRTRQFNELISQSAREIQSNTLRSKERIGTEMQEVERQRQQLGTAVSVPVDVFQGPAKISDAERFNTFGPDAFLAERSKALTGLGGEFQQALQQNEVESIVSRGNVLASAAQQVREQESYFNELNKVAEKYNLQPDSSGLIDIEKSIPTGVQTIRGETVVFTPSKRKEIKDELTSIAKRFEKGEQKTSELKKQFKEQGIKLDSPSVEEASKLKPQTFFGGATSFLEEVRSEIGKVEQARKTKKSKEPSIENLLKQKIVRGKPSLAKSVLQESEKISPTRFVSSLPIGITRPLGFVEDIAREDVQLLRQALTPGKTPKKDLQKIAPITSSLADITSSIAEKDLPKVPGILATGFLKKGSVIDAQQELSQRIIKKYGVPIGIGLGKTILKDPSGELGEIIAPALLIGGAKAISSGLKSKSVTELQKVVRATDPKFFRSSKFFSDNIDDVSRIGYSRLEAGTSKFLSVGDKTDDALKLAVKKASSKARENIDDLTRFKIQKVSSSLEQRTYLEKLKKQILSEKQQKSILKEAQEKIVRVDYLKIRDRVLLGETKRQQALKLVESLKKEGSLIDDLAIQKLKANLLAESKASPLKGSKTISSFKTKEQITKEAFAKMRKEATFADDLATQKLKSDLLLEKIDVLPRTSITIKTKEQIAKETIRSKTSFVDDVLKDKKALDLQSLADDFLRTKQERAILNKLKQAQLERSWQTQLTNQRSLVEKELLARDLEILKKLQTKQFSDIAKDLGLDKGKGLSGIGSTKPKPPSPPASGLVSVSQKDGTMLLQRLGGDSKALNEIISKTGIKKSVDSKAFDIVKKASVESKRIFPKIKPLSETLEKARGVQPVYGFSIPGIKVVSDELTKKLRGFRQEESSLEQIARNIGVGEIPSQTDFFKQQEPRLIKLGDSRFVPQSAEQLNQQLFDRGLRNIGDISRGVSLSRTKEQTSIAEKIGLQEKAIIKDIVDTKTGVDTRFNQSIKAVSGVQQKQDVRLKEKFKQLTDTRIDFGQIVKTKTIRKPRLKIKTRTDTRLDIQKQEEIKPKILFFPFGLLEDDKKKKQLQRLYKFYEIRGEPRGGRKTKRFIGTFPLIKGLNIGAKIVGESPSRTIKYTPTRFKSLGKDDVRFKYAGQFRRPGRTTKLSGSPGARFLVEKAKFAISSPGEKRGITLKGIKARQSKARINFSKLGLNNRRGKNVRKKK